MKATRSLKLLITFVSLFFLLRRAEAGHPEFALVPGKAAGSVTLGEELSKVEELLGKADSVDTSLGQQWSVWKIDPEHGTVGLFCRRPDGQEFTVERIRVTSREYVLNQGISVGSTLAEIQEQFPEIQFASHYQSSTRHQSVTVYDVASQGVTFEMSISVDGLTRCVAISIRTPHTGLAVTGDQLDQW